MCMDGVMFWFEINDVTVWEFGNSKEGKIF